MPHRDPNLPISLFLPFYTPKDSLRAAELLDCLKRNLDCGIFAKIILLQDDDTPMPFDDPRLEVIRLNQRPTYLDWVLKSQALCPNHISVLANSDIWFDNTIGFLRAIFAADTRSFVALSRYEAKEGKIQPHENPHWSQDTWAFYPMENITPTMLLQLNIALGVPRCDNKISYVFSVNGYTVFNPMHDIISVHQHESNLRYYDKTGDNSIVGGMAMVQPGKGLMVPASLDIQVWSENTKQYNSFSVNRTLEKWRDQKYSELEVGRGVFGYDTHWQYPAITEQHAFRQMKKLSPPRESDDNPIYIGFPWATLIDLKRQQSLQTERILKLETELKILVDRIGPQKRVLTVCQQIHTHRFPEIFKSAGVTDIFWTHAVKNQPTFPDVPGITFHPFPLYPVQQIITNIDDLDKPRKYLFSFVGARSSDIYLTQARSWILDELAGDPRGVVTIRNAWHYDNIVYERQIKNNHRNSENLVDKFATTEFQAVMSETIFSLCPSGSGPNSIRLWEAALNGSIPVILADTYRHPGDECLWNMATVSCRENPEDIRALPDRLSAIAADPELLHRKRTALYLLMQKYGPDRFVHDIITLMQSQP